MNAIEVLMVAVWINMCRPEATHLLMKWTRNYRGGVRTDVGKGEDTNDI